MYLLARLYATEDQARAATAALLAAGYSSDDVAVLTSAASNSSSATPTSANTEPAAADDSAALAAPVATSSASSSEDAARIRTMLGYRADFYVSRVADGRGLVVATPPWHSSRQAELILDEHQPLAISHEPPPAPFVPASQQAAPLSNLLGLKVLSDGPVLSSYSTKKEPFSLSNKLGMRMLSDKATPLSSLLGLSTQSKRIEGKSASFGMSLTASRATPLSSMFGLSVLSQRQHFLS